MVPPTGFFVSGSNLRYMTMKPSHKRLLECWSAAGRPLPGDDKIKVFLKVLGIEEKQAGYSLAPEQVIAATNCELAALVGRDPLRREYIWQGLMARPDPKHNPPTLFKCVLVDPPWPSCETAFYQSRRQFKTVLVDPPWPTTNSRFVDARIAPDTRARRQKYGPYGVPYNLMTLEQIAALPIPALADEQSHLWVWTTNAFLPATIELIRGWGFKYMNTITWVKPSGVGPWWVSRTQFLLHAYRGKCKFKKKPLPNVIFAPARRHSQKPAQAYELIETVSFAPRLELFARNARPGWGVWGNEIESTVNIEQYAACAAEIKAATA